MGQLKHLLRGLVCSFLGRPTRRPRLGAAPLAGRVQERRRKHFDRCAACRARQQRERQYLERLRGAAVPAASRDLTARLLARTGELAAGPAQAAPGRAAAPAVPPPPLPDRAGRWRFAALTAGGVAATTALLGGAAYLLGGEPAPSANGAFVSALPGRLPGPALSSERVSGSAWKLSGEPDVAPAGSLSSEQLAALRDRGWACPELRELGYHLLWARTGTAYGSKVLELRLTDGRHFATVLEQHADGRPDGRPDGLPDGRDAAGAGRAASAAPINILTGHPATDDGFVAARPDSTAVPEDAAPKAGALWVHRQAPFRAIYRTPEATFTYISDLPAEQADDGVGALVRARPGGAAPAQGAGGIPARLERGLERIVELLAR